MDADTSFDLGAEISSMVGRVVRHDAYMMAGLDPVTSAGCLLATDHQFTARTVRGLQYEGAKNRKRHAFDYSDRDAGSATILPQETWAHGLRTLFAKEGIGAPMFVVLRRGTVARGRLVLLRGTDLPAFSKKEAAIAGQLTDALAHRVERFVAGMPLRPAEPGPRPGVLLFGSDNVISGITPAGLAALRRLAPGGRGVTDEELSGSLWNLVIAARLDGAGLTRVPTRQGWFSLHAEPVDESGAVAVTIDSASGAVLLPAVASWFGITPREQAVVRQALAGEPAKRIARQLDLSLYTVNDHLKAVYRKTGLAGREELAAGLTR